MKVDLNKIEALIAPILSSLGYELVETTCLQGGGRQVLRVMVDRDGGITVGDCVKVSREIESPLEIEGLITEKYALEVTSPGLDRPLVKEGDYVRFAGQKISLQTSEPIEGRRNYKGTLKGIDAGVIEVIVDQQSYKIPFSLIHRAHLVYL